MSASSKIPTGMRWFDEAMGGGLMPGSVVVLVGRPGVGKTALVMQLLASAARVRRCALFSAEQTFAALNASMMRVAGPNTVSLREINNIVEVSADDTSVFDVMAVDSAESVVGSTYHASKRRIIHEFCQLVWRRRICGIITTIGVKRDGRTTASIEHIADTLLYLNYGAVEYDRVLSCDKHRDGRAFEKVLKITHDGRIVDPKEL